MSYAAAAEVAASPVTKELVAAATAAAPALAGIGGWLRARAKRATLRGQAQELTRILKELDSMPSGPIVDRLRGVFSEQRMRWLRLFSVIDAWLPDFAAPRAALMTIAGAMLGMVVYFDFPADDLTLASGLEAFLDPALVVAAVLVAALSLAPEGLFTFSSRKRRLQQRYEAIRKQTFDDIWLDLLDVLGELELDPSKTRKP